MAQVEPKNSTHALLGYYKGNVGVVCWHDNELEAWRNAKQINNDGGKVKVVPVEDGNLSEEHNKEKSELFAKHYQKYC